VVSVVKWRILYVRPRFEKKIHQQLLDLDIESFLPLREEVRQWSDRKKKVIVPLFNGYIFVRVDERQRIKALDIYGVLKYIHFSGVIVEVRPEIIESIRIAVSGPRKLDVLPERLPEGTPVKVIHGPLTGLRGELSQYRGSSKVAIFVDGIRQSVVVEVDLAEIEVVGRKG
jgi:transcription termination/antitermination protein NusG